MNNTAIQVVAVVNGPGEVAAWLYPFAEALRSHHANVRLRAALLPCVFASGQESAVLDGMPGIDAVCTPRATLRWIARGDVPAGFESGGRGCVVHFGGELLLSIALARRLHQPIVVYEEQRVRWSTLLDKVCVVNERVGGVNGNHKVRAIGNLMVDAARLRVPRRHTPNGGPRSVALFPGSRQYFVREILPFLLRVAAQVERTLPGTCWVLSKSDFITHDELANLVAGSNHRVLEGDTAQWEDLTSREVLVSSAGVRVRVASPAEAMADADLAITIPGTSTAELAALGIPMILALPTYRLHTLPLPGLAGHLGGIPVLGPAIKEAVARTYIRTRRFWAHPNRLAAERIVPELVGPISASDVATEVTASLRANGNGDMAKRLRLVMGEPGAALRLVDEVLATLRS
ncbi:MAG: hypothetical protein ACREOG_16565 [Gemmatimonadaceae bacterium]